MREKLTLTFKIYDINKNGRIEKNEIEKIIEALCLISNDYDDKLVKNKVSDILKKLDTNNDGSLSLEEFVEGCIQDPSIANALSFQSGEQ